MSDAIKLPVRIVRITLDGFYIGDSNNRCLCECRGYEAAKLVADAINSAPALAALEAVAREALEDARLETSGLMAELDDQIFTGCSDASTRSTRQDIGKSEAKESRIKAALAIAGATLDGKDAKP